jgi:thioredoxin-dependent peroxiredoxin
MNRLSGWLFPKTEALALDSPIPELAIPDHSGALVTLPAKGWTFLYFYPRADTPGCTKQACSLRDAYESLLDEGVNVFGASLDSLVSLRKFREKYRLPFTLLADTEGKLADAFAVPRSFGFTRRQAFLFKDGLLVWRDLAASTDLQAADALTAIRNHR